MSDRKVKLAWAAVAKLDGRILRDGKRCLGIYTHKQDAIDDCPKYGEVKRVRVTVVKESNVDKGTATGWIAAHNTGRVHHFSVADGWTVEVVAK